MYVCTDYRESWAAGKWARVVNEALYFVLCALRFVLRDHPQIALITPIFKTLTS
jgi:hypothetical protein